MRTFIYIWKVVAKAHNWFENSRTIRIVSVITRVKRYEVTDMAHPVP